MADIDFGPAIWNRATGPRSRPERPTMAAMSRSRWQPPAKRCCQRSSVKPGWPIAANPRGLEPMPIKPGSPTVAMPGYDVQVLDENGAPVGPGEEGNICLKLPLPPGTLPTLWNDDHRYVDSYLSVFNGFYTTGDGGSIDADGYVRIVDRKKELIINAAGKNMSPANIEQQLRASSPLIAQAVCIGDRRPYNVALLVLDPDYAMSGKMSVHVWPTTVVLAGGTLDLNGFSGTVNNLSGSTDIALGSATLTVNQALAGTYSGQISGTGGLPLSVPSGMSKLS